MTEPWASVDEVAKHLGLAKDSIYQWIENRGSPAHKIGRRWKFKLSEVDEWVRWQDSSVSNDEPGPGAADDRALPCSFWRTSFAQAPRRRSR